MEGEASRATHKFKEMSRMNASNLIANTETNLISVDLFLPDDLLGKIFSFLPMASIARIGCVCKRWHEIVNSSRVFSTRIQKPWYFMFTNSDEPTGFAYDPVLKKWYNINLPFVEKSDWSISSSRGLICTMDNDSKSQLYVSNPMTRHSVKLQGPPGSKFADYTALSIHVHEKTRNYNIAITKSKQLPGELFQCEIWIHIHNSAIMTWTTPLTEVLTGWRGGNESVICGGVLYFLIYSTGCGLSDNRHGLIGFSLENRPLNQNSLIRSIIKAPCSLTCGRLMNLNENLVMVGGIGRRDRTDIIKGIGIWILKEGIKWEEIDRMPHRFFHGFGELDDVFASSGTDELLYIHSYGAPALLVFNLKLKIWKWCSKCPVNKRSPLQLFTGFCFEPSLETVP